MSASKATGNKCMYIVLLLVMGGLAFNMYYTQSEVSKIQQKLKMIGARENRTRDDVVDLLRKAKSEQEQLPPTEQCNDAPESSNPSGAV